MAQKTVQGNEDLAKKIKQRRNELGLTIEEAATKAGVGTKTWSRYEAGQSIRKDKCKGICKALNWHSLSDQDENDYAITIDEYKKHEAWSGFLEKEFGALAALSFAAGSDIIYDHIKEDLNSLSTMPKGTHIGQLSFSWLRDILPEQFLISYDYDFLFQMKCSIINLRKSARSGYPMIAHSVLQELIIYLCNEESASFIELFEAGDLVNDSSEDWVFGLFDDMDIITFLYSNIYITPDNSYHFSHWGEMQFYIE